MGVNVLARGTSCEYMFTYRIGDSTTVQQLDERSETTDLSSKEVPAAHSFAD